MRVHRGVERWRRGVLMASAVLVSGCAPRAPDAFPGPFASAEATRMCTVVVYNRTASALAIRVGVRPLATWPIGELNPTELLTHELPCAQRYVYVRGVGMAQVGVPAGSVHGWAELVEGERVAINLGLF